MLDAVRMHCHHLVETIESHPGHPLAPTVRSAFLRCMASARAGRIGCGPGSSGSTVGVLASKPIGY
jgi:hypothetical protein